MYLSLRGTVVLNLELHAFKLRFSVLHLLLFALCCAAFADRRHRVKDVIISASLFPTSLMKNKRPPGVRSVRRVY